MIDLARECHKPTGVVLTPSEVLTAGHVGLRRNAEAVLNKRKNRFPEKYVGQLWGNHIESACAELSVCKALGVYWGCGVNTFHVPDIHLTDIEVRWSSRADLKVRPDDSGVVVCVTGQCPEYKIVGWIKAEDAKQSKWYYGEPPPCYFVPHNALQDFALLKKQYGRGGMEPPSPTPSVLPIRRF